MPVYFDHAVSFWMHIDTLNIRPEIDLAAFTLSSRTSRCEDSSMLNLFMNNMEACGVKLQDQ